MPSKDILLEYDFEGKGSSAGSVGSCSILEPDNDLNFLTDLGPKFRTLAEICSPPTLTSKAMVIQKASGSVKTTTDITEPVFKPKFNHEIQAKHVDDKAEKVVSSAKVVQSHVSTTTKQLTTTTLPHSTSTNISHSAKLSYPAQTVVLQQPPVYYTASPVLQPMHYIVQPNVQNTFVLEDGTHANTFPGLYVINDPKSMSGLVYGRTQSSLSGLVIQDTEGPKSPISPVSPTGSLRTTVLLPSPTFSQGCVEGSTLYGQNLGGNYVLLKDEVQEWGPGSPQGILPGDAILVKKAAPPQGVLGLAAQQNVCICSFCYFLVKKANGGGGVIVTGGISFGSFSVLKYLTKQQRMWIWLNKVKVDELNFNIFQRSCQLNQAIPSSCVLSYRQELSIEVQNNTIIFYPYKRKTAKADKEIIKKKLPKNKNLQEIIMFKIAANSCIKHQKYLYLECIYFFIIFLYRLQF